MNAPYLPRPTPAASIAATTQIRGVIVPRSDRDADLAVIAAHHGHDATDDMVMFRVRSRLGWAMLTDEALAMLAREYEVNHATRERMNAEYRALVAGRAA